MKQDQLRKELGKGRIRPAYLLLGEEPLLRDEALAAIRAGVLDPEAEDFNLTRLSGTSATPAELEEATRSLPVMAPRRLVILSEPEAKRGGSKVLADALVEVVKSVREQEETVLVVTAAKADGRSRWVKAFADPAARLECDPPKAGKALTSFIESEAKRQGLELESGAAELFAERVGPQLLLLRQEIAKAGLLVPPGERVTRAHVAAGTSDVAEESIFELTDAIGAGRVDEAVALLSRALRTGAPAPVVLAALAGHFRKLARLRSGGRLSGAPFIVKKLERQAGRYRAQRLHDCLGAIHNTDTALKGVGALSGELALEQLVIGLAS